MTIEEQEARWKETVKDLDELWFAIPKHRELPPRYTIGTHKVWRVELLDGTLGWARLTAANLQPTYYLPAAVANEAVMEFATAHGITPQWAASSERNYRGVNFRHAADIVLAATLPRQAQLLMDIHSRGIKPLPLSRETGNPPSA